MNLRKARLALGIPLLAAAIAVSTACGAVAVPEARINLIFDQGPEVMVYRGLEQGVVTGMVFDVVRDGVVMGSLVVTEALEHLSRAEITAMTPGFDIRVGDGLALRMTRSPGHSREPVFAPEPEPEPVAFEAPVPVQEPATLPDEETPAAASIVEDHADHGDEDYDYLDSPDHDLALDAPAEPEPQEDRMLDVQEMVSAFFTPFQSTFGENVDLRNISTDVGVDHDAIRGLIDWKPQTYDP